MVRRMTNQLRDVGRLMNDAQIMYLTSTKKKDKSQNYKENSKRLNPHFLKGNPKKQWKLG